MSPGNHRDVFTPPRLPCAHCGEAVARTGTESHRCDPRRLLECRVLITRHEVAAFDRHLQAFLAGKHGRFETWLAARQVRRTT